MSITTEQAALNIMFPNDSTKTINDVIRGVTNLGVSEDTVKNAIRQSFPDVTDWSF